MDQAQYLLLKKELQSKFLQIISDNSEIGFNSEWPDFSQYFQNLQFFENPHEFKIILTFILKISNNYRRTPVFFSRIVQILLLIKDKIKQTFTNSEIFNIFQNNKRLLLFLLKEKIIIPDQSIIEILSAKKFRRLNYIIYLYSELKPFLDEEALTQTKDKIKTSLNLDDEDENFSQIFEKMQIEGENENHLCELIRNDSIDEFIINYNKTNFSLSMTIKPSIFETNTFLLKNRPSLIEYAAFYGSIQIFQFLNLNGVELKPSLWLYTIHGGNPELIHMLENNRVGYPNDSYQKCLDEALKCHNFEITNYIKNNNQNEGKKLDFSLSVKFMNFSYFPNDLSGSISFFYLCKYDYLDIVENIIQTGNFKNGTVVTPLQIAVDRNNSEIVQLLMNDQRYCKEAFKKKAFYNCSTLKQIEIPLFITEIGESSFNGCSSLASIIIHPSVKVFGDYCFSGCSSLKEILIPNSIESIGKGCFVDCSSIEEIILPDSIKMIKESTFSQCSSLISISIPFSVEIIEGSAFSFCSALKRIEIPQTVKEISEHTFTECSSLEKIIIPPSVTLIGNFAFSKCTSLTKIVLPNSIVSIGDGAFCECESLLQISIPNSVIELNTAVFSDCISLNKVSLSASLEKIGEFAFSSCSSLKEIEIPLSVKRIENSAFCNCSALETITMPPSVEVGDSVFEGCTSLKK